MPNEEVKAAIEERQRVIKNLEFIGSALEQDGLKNFAKILSDAAVSYAKLFDKAYRNDKDHMLY